MARQYKGVMKTVNGDNIRLLVVISFTQVLARQPEGTSTGRTRPHWVLCPQQLPSLGSHVGPGWLDQQRRRYPKHRDMLSLGGLLTPRLTTNPGGRGLGITVNGDSIRLLVVMSFTPVLARQPEGTSTGRTRPHRARCPSSCPRWAPVYWHDSLKGH